MVGMRTSVIIPNSHAKRILRASRDFGKACYGGRATGPRHQMSQVAEMPRRRTPLRRGIQLIASPAGSAQTTAPEPHPHPARLAGPGA